MSWYAPPGEFCPESHIDWEGELSVDDEKLVSGFMAAHVQVKVSASKNSIRLSVNLLHTGLHLPYNNPAQHLQTDITSSPKSYHPYQTCDRLVHRNYGARNDNRALKPYFSCFSQRFYMTILCHTYSNL